MIDYKNILFCTDFSEDANIAFLHALDLAKKYGAKLHILHVPHSSYKYARHVVDEHVTKGADNKEGFYSEEVEKKAKEALQAEYGQKLEGLASIVEGLDLETGLLQRYGHRFTRAGLVVDHKDLREHGHTDAILA